MKDKKISSEFAIGIVIIVAIVVGVFVWLQNERQELNKIVSAPCNQADQVVFLGDSITALGKWNEFFRSSCMINSGIPGNTADDVISRINSVVASQPKKIFLMIGINDFLRGKNVDEVFANYEKIIKQIREKSPKTLIYIQSNLPINNDVLKSTTANSQEIVDLNEKLKGLTDENRIFFIDLYHSFCGADNKMYKRYAGDGLHPSSVGYGVWKKTIAQYVQ